MEQQCDFGLVRGPGEALHLGQTEDFEDKVDGLVLFVEGKSTSAAVWWMAAVIACFGTEAQSTIMFLVAIFHCQIVFGIYGLIAEAQEGKQRGLIHA